MAHSLSPSFRGILLAGFVLASPCLVAQTPGQSASPRFDPVPLSRYTDSTWPLGIDLGPSTGISFGDYDADGWVDLFAFSSGHLWRNLEGTGWELAADLDSILPWAAVRYGSSFGDYNADGLPDIATEPRVGGGDDCLHILRNLGGGPFFEDIATNPALLDYQPCGAMSETICWADVDGDLDLDLFLPTYPDHGSIDNQFLHNRGPTGPGGQFRFTEESGQAGLKIPDGADRPEGCQFLDTDGDGDLELYSNGHLYRNLSTFDQPLFEFLKASSSGIRLRAITDEGALFLDHDLDGDYDLLVSYTSGRGVRLWESQGDGTFVAAPLDLIQDYQTGASYGLSAADWDMDGDIDFLALDTFRRNILIESGRPGFLLAETSIPWDDLRGAAPAWADWDKDGDPDLAVANGHFPSYLFQNDTYGASTPPQERRHLRIRPYRESLSVPRGLETEFGASVEVQLEGVHSVTTDDGFRRKRFTSSAAGYINQDEYVLGFALPADPEPGIAEIDVDFSLAVDFPSLPEQGYWRVDRFVNPALANINLASLEGSREVSVSRAGTVVINGCPLVPNPPPDPTLVTSTGGLVAPTQSVGLDDPVISPSSDQFAGIEIITSPSTHPLLVKEIILDGVPGQAVEYGDAGADANLVLWDVTDPARPEVADPGRMALPVHPRNHRGHFPSNFILQPGRTYRLIARVSAFRPSPIQGPVDHGSFSITGGLLFQDSSPHSGSGVVGASLDSSQVYLAVRVATDPPWTWVNLGAGSPGSTGEPLLSAMGAAMPGGTMVFSLSGALPDSPVHLLAGFGAACRDLGGMWLVPAMAFSAIPGLRTDSMGNLSANLTWPLNIRGPGRGTSLIFQALIQDSAGNSGFAASNAVATLTQD